MDESGILRRVEEANALKSTFFAKNTAGLARAGDCLVRCLRAGGKLLFFGNGGSAAEAQHAAAEYVNRMGRDRPGMMALALTNDTSILTAITNDAGFSRVFARQIEALGKAGDVAIAITTSGNSPNVVEGLKTARALGLRTVALLGRDGGRALEHADHPLVVPSSDAQRVQEVHLAIEHILCEYVEEALFPPTA